MSPIYCSRTFIDVKQKSGSGGANEMRPTAALMPGATAIRGATNRLRNFWRFEENGEGEEDRGQLCGQASAEKNYWRSGNPMRWRRRCPTRQPMSQPPPRFTDRQNDRYRFYPGVERPAFQFYPADEESEPSLRSCSLAAFGLWRRMLNLMHVGKPYGHLTMPAGVPIEPKQLARMVNATAATVKRLLDELENSGTFSRNDQGVIYSRRMVWDEYRRNSSAAGGKQSQNNPNVPRRKNAEQGQAEGYPEGYPSTPSSMPSLDPSSMPSLDPSASSSSSSSSKTTKALCADAHGVPSKSSVDGEAFERFWSAWPRSERKGGKQDCYAIWKKIGANERAEQILAHVEQRKRSRDWRKDNGQFIPAPKKYLSERQWDGADQQRRTVETDV